MNIRESTADAIKAIQKVHQSAFGDQEGPIISRLVEEMFADDSASPMLSLIAEENGKVAGNVIFSPMKLLNENKLSAFLLAPLAILPDFQKSGLGSKLVRNGLNKLGELNADLVLVYGDPAYYSRFGFIQNHKIIAPYKLQHPHGWQALELKQGILEAAEGPVKCANSLMKPELW